MPDFPKFDLQSIINNVKSIISPEAGTPKVSEGDPIGTKIVQISALLQNTAKANAQSAKDLTQINNLLNELYKDLESFRQLEAELRQKQQAAEAQAHAQTAQAQAQATPQATHGQARVTPSTGSTTTGANQTVHSTGSQTHAGSTVPHTAENKIKESEKTSAGLHPGQINLKSENVDLDKVEDSLKSTKDTPANKPTNKE